jgi:putative ABC transport system permease protein
MPLFTRLGWFFRDLFRKERLEREIEDEVRSYVELLVDEKIRGGMDPHAARREALLAVGGMEQIKEEIRGVRASSFIDTLLQDVRYGARSLASQPGFSTVAILTLAIAIGANTAIFSFIDGTLLKPLPYKDAERIVMLWEKPPGFDRNSISTLNFLDWKAQNTVFESIAAVGGQGFTLSGSGGEPEQLAGTIASASYFDVMGTQAALGRTFAAGEDEPGNEHVIVLTNRVWQNRFGADPGIVGRTLTLNKKPYNVIGVLPAGVYDRGFADVYAPLAFTPDRMTRDFHWFRALARLKAGVTIEQARAQMDAIAARIAADYPDIKKGWGITIDRFEERVVGDQTRRSLYVLLAAVGGVLLIGCANLANLMLARNAGRAREVAVRFALGAGKLRLVRQLLTESILVSCLGAGVGIGLGYSLMRAMQFSIPRFMLPAEANVTMDWRVLAFTAAIALLTGILFGAAPALQATRGDTTGVLKDGGRGSTSGVGRHRLRTALIVTEVALAFVLLTGAGLLMRSFTRLLDVDPGFEAENTISMNLPRVMGEDTDGPLLTSYYERVVSQIRAAPGVRDAAVTSARPLSGWGFGMPFTIQGKESGDRAGRKACFFKTVSPSYFSTIGMRLKSGRLLTERDVAGAPPVTVINETFAKRFLENEDPIGQRILIEQIITGKTELGPEIPWEVVGVVADEKVISLDNESPGVYVPAAQSPVVGVALVVRALGDPNQLLKAIQSAVWTIDKNQALTDVKTLEQIKSDSLGSNRLRTGLLGVFAAIALLLAAVGVYGVISYSVAQRRHEMGIRTALGASSGDLVRLVVRHGMLVALSGLVIGSLGAFALTRFLASLLFNTSPTDIPTMAAVACVLALVALLACYIPARRTTRVDPIVALRDA